MNYKREIKEEIPLTIASERIQFLGINLPKKVENLYLENCKTLRKDTEDNTNR